MRRRISLVVLVVAMCALVHWTVQRQHSTPQPLTRDIPSAPVLRTSELTSARDLGPAARAEVQEKRPSSQTGLDAGRSSIVGRIVDAQHTPIVGQKVRLRSPGTPWCATEDPPRVEEPGFDLHAWESVTDAGGAFLFDVPVPTAQWFELSSPPPLYTTRLFVQFQRMFRSGKNDLGEFVLDLRGAIGGLLTDESGSPVNMALVMSPSAQASVHSDERGRYVLGGLPEGLVPILVRTPTHIALEPAPIEVKSGSTTIADFVLRAAPVLAGRIVDPDGRPIAGADLVARLDDFKDERSLGRSVEDGTFEIHLAKPGRRFLEVRREGYLRPNFPQPFAPNTRDIEVVLQPAPKITMRVVDARTSAPIERFGFELVFAEDIDRRVPLANFYRYPSRPGGEVTTPADIGKQYVRVSASGYAKVETRVIPDEDQPGIQTIRMHTGATIRGRLVEGVQPASDATVRASSTFIGDTGTRPYSGIVLMDLSFWLGLDHSARCDAAGDFHVDHLPSGTWSITSSSPTATPRIIVAGHVDEDATLDIGTIEVAPGAKIEGKLIVPEGRSAANIRVGIDPSGFGSGISDATGAFLFEGLSAGKHVITCVGNDSAGTGDHVLDVELSAGETKSLTIDLRGTRPAHVRVRVTRNGSPVGGVKVAAEVMGSALPVDATTGADGRADVPCPSELPVTLSVPGAGGMPLGSTTPVTLQSDQRVEIEIAIVEGRLEMQLPPLLGTPDMGSLSISLTTPDGRRCTLEARTKSLIGARDVDWSSERVAIGSIPPGEYAVEVVVRTLQGEAWFDTCRLACHISVRGDETTVAEPK
jgi:hypothetical protein